MQVIKALYDHQPEPGRTQELAFHKGDFFHVISQEDDPYWYEACNPLIPNARGLVPVPFFEVIGKTERQSAGSTASGASSTLPPTNTLPPHDSGYSEMGGHSTRDSNLTARKAGHTRQPSTGKGSGAMVYGIVQYDFNAERPDELEAKQGEPIIVIAQSNPEWFVAKPIGRLGGPGLIPVSFIEIRDMTTGQAVPDAQEAVTRAGVPKVEEWKKMAADYKNSSIALGKFESGNQASIQRGMERISLSNGNQPTANGHAYVKSPCNLFTSILMLISFSPTIMIITKGMVAERISNIKTITAINHRRPYLLLSLHRFPVFALPMTNIGTLSNAFWRTAGIGSFLDFTRTSTTFKSSSCRSSPKRLAKKAELVHYRTCQARSPMSQMRSRKVDVKA